MTDSKFPQQDADVAQSNSAIKRQARIDNSNLKAFGGKTSGFTDNRDRHFNQRMLKAYLRGDHKFQFGQSYKKNQFGIPELSPDWHDVLFTDETKRSAGNSVTPKGKVFGGMGIGKSELRKVILKRQQDKRKAKSLVLSKQDVDHFTKEKK